MAADGTVTIEIKATGADSVAKQAESIKREFSSIDPAIKKSGSTLDSLKSKLNMSAPVQAAKRAFSGLGTGMSSAVTKAKSALTGLGSGLKTAGSKFMELGRDSESAGGLLGSFREKLSFGAIAGAASSAITALTGGIGDLISQAVSASDAMDKFKSTMKFAGFSDKEIGTASKAVKKYADETVYELSDVSNTTAQLAANGIKNYTGLTQAAGNLNAVAGGNADTFKSVAMMLTQTAGAGKLTTENWNQLADAIPGASGQLQAAMKKNGAYTGNFRDAMADGQITSDEFNKALYQLGMNDSAVKAAKSTQTFEGAIGNLQANVVTGINNIINTIGKAKITTLIGQISNGIVGGLSAVANALVFVSAHADVFKAVAVGVIAVTAAMKGAVVVSSLLNAALTANPFGIVVKLLAMVTAGLVYFFTKTKTGQALWAKFMAFLKGSMSGVVSFFTSAWSAITSAFSSAMKAIEPVTSAIGGFFSTLATSAKTALSSGLSKLAPLFSQMGAAVSKLGSAGLKQIGPLLDHMGGSFGKLGALIGPAISLLTKVGLAAVGITGPWGIAISAIASFIGMWAKTGELNADGVTQVFDGISSSIENFSNLIATYLPQIISVGTDLIVSLISGITAQIPQLVTVATNILTTLVTAIVTVLPTLITAGTQILTGLISAITAALPTLVQAGITIITGLLNALVLALPLLISAGIQVMMAILNALIAALPTIISAGVQILNALIMGIVQVLPMLVTAALQVIMALFNALIAALPTIIDAGVKILMALIDGLIQILPQLVNAALKIVTALFGALVKNAPKIIDAGVKLLTALINGLIKILPQLVSAAFKIAVALFTALVKNAPKILSAGVQLIKALISGVLKLIGQVGSAALKIGGKVISAIAGKAKSMASAGVDFVKGFIGGIGSMVGKVVQTAENIGKKAVDGVKKFLHIGSPSRVMRQIGVWTGEGFTNGMKDMLPKVSTMSDKMARAATIDTPAVSLGSVTGGRLTAEGLAGGRLSTLVSGGSSSNTVNNYTTNNTQGGMTDEVIGLLQTIADKSPVISGSSVVPALSPYIAQHQQTRQNLANRGATVNVTL